MAYLSGRADPLEERQVEDDEDQEDAEQQLPLWTAEVVHAGARVQLQHRAAVKGNTARCEQWHPPLGKKQILS